jgi:hypothetical protein
MRDDRFMVKSTVQISSTSNLSKVDLIHSRVEFPVINPVVIILFTGGKYIEVMKLPWVYSNFKDSTKLLYTGMDVRHYLSQIWRTYMKELCETRSLEIPGSLIRVLGPNFLERTHLLTSYITGSARHLEHVGKVFDYNTSKHVYKDVLKMD